MKSEDVTGRRLPGQLTTFVGRATELSELRRLLLASRLITIIGQGGVGKTRLALRAAERFHGVFPDSYAVVQLGPLGHAELLPTAIADALGIGTSSRPPLELIVSFLRERRMLLILDNCEHLSDEVGCVVQEILSAAPRVTVLVTSRQSLHIGAEHVFEVQPLQLPNGLMSLEAALAFPAVALFIDRASAAVPGFVATDENIQQLAELCAKLDGLPLAIELAAVRLRVLSLSELMTRLHGRLDVLADTGSDRPARHRTLHASLDWTFELCSPVEREIWAIAALFPGGFTVEAIEQVHSPNGDVPEGYLLGGLSGLVDKSVLTRVERDGRSRFVMLATIKSYADALFEVHPRAVDLRSQFLRWCRIMVDDAATNWFTEESTRFAYLVDEHANIRAAMSMCLSDERYRRIGLHLAAELWFFWIPRAPAEGRQWLERLLEASSSECDLPERGRALVALAYLLVMQGERGRAKLLLRESRDIARQSNDDLWDSYATHVEGLSEFFEGNFDAASQLFDQAMTRYITHASSPGWIVALQMHRGLLQILHGDLIAARESLRAAEKICQNSGENWLYSYVLYGLALVAYEESRYEDARSLLQRCVQLKEPFDDIVGTALAFELTAWLQVADEAAAPASIAMGAARRLWHDFGVELYGSRPWLERRRMCEDGAIALIGAERFQQGLAEGERLSRSEALTATLGASSAESSLCSKTATNAPPGNSPLSRRESQVAVLVAEGLTNRAIAERLTVSPRTVDGHVQQILNKLGFNSRAQIAVWVTTHKSEGVSSGTTPRPRAS